MSIRARFDIRRRDFSLAVDLDLPGSGVTSLFGPSGCGKTTLLRAIAGLERHAGGFLCVHGEIWQDEDVFLPPHRRPVGYVFQEPSLFEHLDVRRNITYGMQRAPAGERRVALAHTIELLGLERLLDRRPGSLSGGERQRVAIARALAVSPRLLLMDEPLAAVDMERKQDILPWIESLHRELNIPVIHVSHLPEEVAQFADKVVLIGDGGVLGSGGVQELFSRLDLPPARGADAAAVIEATVDGHDEPFHLTRLRFAGGRLLVTRNELPEGRAVRVRIAARDVSLTLERQSGTSILNILEATVEAVRAEDEGRVLLRLRAGDTPLLAGITQKSMQEMQLAPGRAVFAQVKAVALLN